MDDISYNNLNGERFHYYKGKIRTHITSFPMYQHFTDQLLICSERYYKDDTKPPYISDYAFDMMEKLLQDYEKRNPAKVVPWSRSLNGVGWNKTLQDRFDYLMGKADD